MMVFKTGNLGLMTKRVLVAIVVALGLFGEVPELGSDWWGNPFGQIEALLLDRETQRIAFCCLGICFLTFLAFYSSPNREGFWRLRNSQLWLLTGLSIAALHFFEDDATPLEAKPALRLITIVAIGYGVAAVGWRPRSSGDASTKPAWIGSPAFGQGLLVYLVILLVFASVWQRDAANLFKYRGEVRWNGPWDNPNTFGLLMGCGLLLALGLALKWGAEARGSIGKRLMTILSLIALILTGRGLFHSYSRGAWLGTALAALYLGTHWFRTLSFKRAEPNRSASAAGRENSDLNSKTESAVRMVFGRWKRSWMASIILLGALGLLLALNFRHTDHLVLRRVLSVGNVNDFSWRNRLAGWEGALQIAAERPWFGAGWKVRDKIYDQYYRPPTIDEGLAIATNDYLMLAATVGIPAMLCFLVYFWASLAAPSKTAVRRGAFIYLEGEPQDVNWLHTICRSGAMVLAIGFWFDGGLFSKLATGTLFWVLLELGTVMSTAGPRRGPQHP